MLSREEILSDLILEKVRESEWNDPIVRAQELYRRLSYVHQHPWTEEQDKDNKTILYALKKRRLTKNIPDRGKRKLPRIVRVDYLEDFRCLLSVLNRCFYTDNPWDIDEYSEHEAAHAEVAQEITSKYGGEFYYAGYFIQRRRIKEFHCITSLTVPSSVPDEELIRMYLAPKEPSEEDLLLAEELSLSGGLCPE